jgi:tRNA nucleotidyltransferase (CCA-adding enzyme)
MYDARRYDCESVSGMVMEVDLGKLSSEDFTVLERLRQVGCAWIVGGWVRDALNDSPKTDLDIATDLTPEEVKKIFPRSIAVGEEFGTIMVRLDTGERTWEVTTLRSEGSYGDGRRPDNVEFGDSIEGDLSRRDFTINAMAIDSEGKLIDLFNGAADLEAGILRTVGNASDRLGEDGLRIMRAFRFLDAEKHGTRQMNSELTKAISSNLKMLDKVSRERIGSELLQILSKPNREEIISLMDSLGVLNVILCDIESSQIQNVSGDEITALAKICSNDSRSGDEISASLRKSLKLSKDQMRLITFLHNNKSIKPSIDLTELRRFRAALPENFQSALLHYHSAEKIRSTLSNLPKLQAGNSPIIDGNKLAQVTGLEPSRKLGRLKGWLHRKQIELDLTEESEVLDWLENIDWQKEDFESWPILVWP